MKKGDLVKVNRGLYYHYGIALSDKEIINYRGEHDDSILNPELVKIIISPLDDFLLNGYLEIEEIENNDRDKSVEIALSFLGNSIFLGSHYDIISNNCEHFARYCITGKKESYQEKTLIENAPILIKKISEQFDDEQIVNKITENILSHINTSNK
jgi:hypothetical protein